MFLFIIIVIVVYFMISAVIYLVETPNSKFGGVVAGGLAVGGQCGCGDKVGGDITLDDAPNSESDDDMRDGLFVENDIKKNKADDKLADETQANDKLADETQANDKLADETQANDKLADNKLANSKLADNKLANSKLADSKPTHEKKSYKKKTNIGDDIFEPKIKPNSRPNNVKACETIIKKKKKNSYDEYDDEKLLGELLPDFAKSFDNIVIDGNNMLFQYAISKGKSPCSTAQEYISNIKEMAKLLNEHFGDKNLYYVFKDSETKKQEADLMALTKTDKPRAAHKKIFEELYVKYPNTRFVVAYGDEKYRDDYAAIWLADTLPDDTILLSRDRFRDVSDMKSQKLKFTTYGKRASKINKIINKPFNFVTKGSVKSALVGYSFNDNNKSGFYQKNKNKKSAASETVYIIGKK